MTSVRHLEFLMIAVSFIAIGDFCCILVFGIVSGIRRDSRHAVLNAT